MTSYYSLEDWQKVPYDIEKGSVDINITLTIKRGRLAAYLCGLVYIVGWIAGFSPQYLHAVATRLASRIIKLEEVT